jgi:hypothetical protein
MTMRFERALYSARQDNMRGWGGALQFHFRSCNRGINDGARGGVVQGKRKSNVHYRITRCVVVCTKAKSTATAFLHCLLVHEAGPGVALSPSSWGIPVIANAPQFDDQWYP